MKALIPAAGHGTRFLPASKTIPKEMLPVGARPAIQLIVEEALDAGADEVVIVTSPDKPSIRRHFEADEVWRGRCASRPEADAELAHLEDVGRRIRWAVQTEQRGLGHAVLQAADVLRDEREPVLVLLGDALVSGEAPSAAMAAISRAHGGASVVGLEEVPPEKVSRYGIVKGERVEMPGVGGETLKLSDLVEKPRLRVLRSRAAICLTPRCSTFSPRSGPAMAARYSSRMPYAAFSRRKRCMDTAIRAVGTTSAIPRDISKLSRHLPRLRRSPKTHTGG